MNILTLDIEDWYNCYFPDGNSDWDSYEVRIDKGVDLILEELEKRGLKATFFCLGWVAEKNPGVVKRIDRNGHQIGFHTYKHQLLSFIGREGFKRETEKSKNLFGEITGKSLTAFRAPGFSVTSATKWAFEVLAETGFEVDCSVFPAHNGYGGLPGYGSGIPKRIDVNGYILKEFPVNTARVAGREFAFSGGGYFRLLPFPLIRFWGSHTDYMMTWFHPRDFDVNQPTISGLPLKNRFKTRVGLQGAFHKWQRLLDEFDFVDLRAADLLTDWENTPLLHLHDL